MSAISVNINTTDREILNKIQIEITQHTHKCTMWCMQSAVNGVVLTVYGLQCEQHTIRTIINSCL